MDVLIVAAQKDLVMSQVSALQFAGSDAVGHRGRTVLDGARDAHARSPQFEQNIAIINIGAASTSINVTKGGFVPFTRNVPIGGNAMTKAIANGLNVSLDEAEKMKREKAAHPFAARSTEPVAPTVTRIFNIITPPLTELVTEIHKSLDYFRTRFRGEDDRVSHLGRRLGALGELRRVSSATNSGCPCTIANPLERAAYDPADFPGRVSYATWAVPDRRRWSWPARFAGRRPNGRSRVSTAAFDRGARL